MRIRYCIASLGRVFGRLEWKFLEMWS